MINIHQHTTDMVNRSSCLPDLQEPMWFILMNQASTVIASVYVH